MFDAGSPVPWPSRHRLRPRDGGPTMARAIVPGPGGARDAVEGKMGHTVSGIVARPQALAGIAAARDLGAPIALRRGLALLPIDDDNVGGLAASVPQDTLDEDALDGFMYLTPAVLSALIELSVGRELAYIETEYFGGIGGQGAVVCEGGRAVIPPAWDKGPRGPVSRALAHLGVRVAPPHLDEFDAVGLGDFRSNDDWRRAHAPR